MRTYSDEEIQSRLQRELPTWTYEAGHVVRTYSTRSWRLSLMVANAVGFLAEAAWHHPDVLVTYPRVTVRLRTHEADGITDKDFDLAQRIESLLTWRPAEGDALTGPPPEWLS